MKIKPENKKDMNLNKNNEENEINVSDFEIIDDLTAENNAGSDVPSTELTTGISLNNDYFKMAMHYQKIIMVYESAIKQIETKLEILNKECKVGRKRNPIETVKSRIKTPDSIAKKLESKGLPVTFQAMTENLNDVAGVRVICPYISDIYNVRDMLLKQPDIHLVKQSDYIETPKESGYRSLHLVIETPVYLSNSVHNVKVEIQLRTIAMDFWASLEHELHYKNTTKVPESVRRELYRVAETIAMTDREMEEIALELQALD